MTPYKVVHLCIPTGQNTINVYSHQFLDSKYLQTGIYDRSEICHILIESKGAKQAEWSTKLYDMYDSAYGYTNLNIVHVDETETLESKLKSLIEYIDDNSLINAQTELVINYGGGLKQYTLLLMAIINNYDQNLSFLLYPDKGQNILTETSFKNQKIQGEVQTELSIRTDSIDILKLYLGKNVVCSKTIIHHSDNTQVNQILTSVIRTLPNMYENSFTSSILFQTAVNAGPEPYEDLSVDMFFSIFDSNTNNEEQKAIRKSYEWYRNKVTQNVVSDFNNKHTRPDDFVLDPEMKLTYTSIDNEISKGIINNLINQFRKIIWSKKHYKNVLNEIQIDDIEKTVLNDIGLMLPAQNQNGNYDKKNLIKNLFHNFNFPKPIDGHGLYFEYYISKMILEKAKQHPCVIKEVAFDICLDKGTQKLLQVDAMIYTANGSLYFIECKTFKFSRTKFVSSLSRVKKLGGVFNQYIIVLPPLPPVENLKLNEKYSKIYKDYKEMTAGYFSVTCCQCINDLSDSSAILEPFQKVLQKIVDRG